MTMGPATMTPVDWSLKPMLLVWWTVLTATLLALLAMPVVKGVQPPSVLRAGSWRSTSAENRSVNAASATAAAAAAALGNRISEDVPMGCKELRSKRYISDGFCTSVKPVTEVVCSGVCLAVHELPWYTHYARLWNRKTADEWRCVDDVVRHKRVYLLCENGEQRAYRIKVVRSCKCKKFRNMHNKTSRKRD